MHIIHVHVQCVLLYKYMYIPILIPKRLILILNTSLYYRQGKCRSTTPTHPCEVGMRRRTCYVLTGSLLGIWTHLENVFLRHPTHAHKMQIVRVHTSQKKIIGKENGDCTV